MSQIIPKEITEEITSVNKYFFTVRNFALKNREQGSWPNTDAAIWALRAGSPANGFGEAFVTVGRRVLINEKNFWLCVNRMQEDSDHACKR